MIRKILAPVQAWILLQGKCVGCGRSLGLGYKVEREDNTQKVYCRCGRIFVFNKRTGKFRRATVEEGKNG